MMTLFFNAQPVRTLDSLKKVDTKRYGKFFHAMLNAGVYFPPSQYEAFFVSSEHTHSDIDRIIEACGDALNKV